jgi:ABC-type Na+ efflux pump permease subunit
MSEQILEQSATASGASLDPSSISEDAPKRRNRTFVIVALALVAGLVIGGIALFLLQPGSSEEVAAGPAPGAGASASGAQAGGDGAAGAASDAGAEEAAAVKAPGKARARLTSRDPFAPIVAKKPAPKPQPAAKPAAPAGSAASTIPAPSTPATGGTISALSVSPLGDEVTLKLDGKKYKVDEGETFAKSYRLYDIFNSNCAGFLYGDRNAVVCEGDSVTIG